MRAFSSAVEGGGLGCGGAASLDSEDAGVALVSFFGLRPGLTFCGRGTGSFSGGRTSGSAEFGGSSGFSEKGYGDGVLRTLS